MAYKYYKDEVVPSTGRKYNITNNDDGTNKIVDVTNYITTGSTFGTADINAIGILECNYSYASNIHALITDNTNTENIKFTATNAFTLGDSITLNGDTVTLKSLDGTTITENAWLADSVVFAFRKDTTLYLMPRASVSGTTLYIRT